MATSVDPVCGFKVVEEIARNDGLMSTYGNQTFFFCCDKCKKEFDADPAAALAAYADRIVKEEQELPIHSPS